MKRASHLDARGQARMVDVAAKAPTERSARAEARMTMSDTAVAIVKRGTAKKGDVLAIARIAGIQAGKRASEWIPLCHTIALSSLVVEIEPIRGGLRIEAIARATDRTGVEMEALVAASAAALTVYDMLKSVDRGMSYSVRLVEKSGGASGHFVAKGAQKTR